MRSTNVNDFTTITYKCLSLPLYSIVFCLIKSINIAFILYKPVSFLILTHFNTEYICFINFQYIFCSIRLIYIHNWSRWSYPFSTTLLLPFGWLLKINVLIIVFLLCLLSKIVTIWKGALHYYWHFIFLNLPWRRLIFGGNMIHLVVHIENCCGQKCHQYIKKNVPAFSICHWHFKS